MSNTMHDFANILGLDPKKVNQHYSIDPHIPLAEKGLTKQSIEKLKTATGLTWSQIASYLHINTRTIQRYHKNQHFPQDISERALRLTDVYAKGYQVFGDQSAFQKWMNLPCPALGNQKPLSFLRSTYGMDTLLKELGRIEHGIFA